MHWILYKKSKQCFESVEDTLYRFQYIKCYVLLGMLKMSKIVFVAFTQHCIQSNVTHVKGVEGVKYHVLYSVYRGLSPLQGEGYLKSLLSCGFSISPPVSLRRQLLTFLPLSTTRMIAGKIHSQSPILKTKGVLSNLVILTYLWEQSCILHTLTKLPAYCQCLKNVGLYKVAGSVFAKLAHTS